MFKYFISVLILSFSTFYAVAQQSDSMVVAAQGKAIEDKVIKQKKQNSLFRDTSKLQSPRKAVLRSAIIPGWGQLRNGKWWKVPLVYGGYVGVGLYYEFNQRYYKEFLTESQARKRSEKHYPQYQFASDQQIYTTKDFYRRNRDLAIIAFFAFHSIQMIDAYIDARLATFDVSDNLSIKITPSVYTPMYAGSAFQTPVPVLKLNIKL